MSADVLRGVRALARYLGVRDERAAELLRSGAIPSRTVGRAYLVSVRAVLAWLERRGEEGGTDAS